MIKTVKICTNGECGGECYRCRLLAMKKERDWYAKMAVELYERLHISGVFGPWSDDWTADHDRLYAEAESIKAEAWDELEEIRKGIRREATSC